MAAQPPSLPQVAAVRLVDHHCHGVLRREVTHSEFEVLLTEADHVGPLGGSPFDSQIGLAVRRWCPPVLDLPAHAQPAAYLDRRAELGGAEVTARFLAAARLGALCVDTGYLPEPLLSPAELGAAAGAPAYEIVRLEQVADEVAGAGVPAAGFADAVRTALARRAARPGVVGCKSIAAYRVGLGLDAARPDPVAVAVAASRWLAAIDAGRPRLADETLHRFLIWCGVDLGLPVQFHVGYGDRSVDLRRCDPLLLGDLLRAIEPTGVPVLLLHNYPFHREAGYLAQVFPHVFVDVGLALNNLGARSVALLAEALELTPFGKFLYSSDAFGLPELYYLASALFRQGLSRLLREGIAEGSWTNADATRITRLVGSENARRVYQMDKS
jgi:predicted TIM-barrel fold metal-dependent hydrolase